MPWEVPSLFGLFALLHVTDMAPDCEAGFRVCSVYFHQWLSLPGAVKGRPSDLLTLISWQSFSSRRKDSFLTLQGRVERKAQRSRHLSDTFLTNPRFAAIRGWLH